MFAGKKDTNINKHKAFAPNTGRNMTKLEALEEADLRDKKDALEREKLLRKERAEMAYLEMVDPAAAQRQQLKFMYDPAYAQDRVEIEKKKDEVAAEDPKAGDGSRDAKRVKREAQVHNHVLGEGIVKSDVDAIGPLQSADKGVATYQKEVALQRKAVSDVRMAREDPMAAVSALKASTQRQTMKDPAMQRMLAARAAALAKRGRE
eukprot:PhM_4_TR13157/c0_g1_i1/m.3690